MWLNSEFGVTMNTASKKKLPKKLKINWVLAKKTAMQLKCVNQDYGPI